jgi:anti-sigma-K factor RskA
LRGRVVALVSPQSGRRFPIAILAPWAVALTLAVALIAVVLPGRLRSGDAAKLAQALSIIGDPAMQDVSFGPPATRGRVFLSPGKGVVLVAAGLPPLDVNKTFELWVIPKTGNPIPAGLFRSQANAAVFVHAGAAPNAAAVAVTIEPEGGSAQPTTTPFIVAKL